MSLYDKLRQLEREEMIKRNEISRCRQEIEDTETRFREKLSIGKNKPCRAALLPDGTIAVHVWVESPTNPKGLGTRLYVVDCEYMNEEGEFRKNPHDVEEEA